MDIIVEEQDIDDICICLAILSCFTEFTGEWFSNVCENANIVLIKWGMSKIAKEQYEHYILKMKYSDLIEMSNGDVNAGKLYITKQGGIMYKGLLDFLSEL